MAGIAVSDELMDLVFLARDHGVDSVETFTTVGNPGFVGTGTPLL